MGAVPSTTAWQRMWPALITFVLLVLVVGCLYWAKPVLIPTALAILLTLLLSPVVTFLHRGGLPKAPAVVLVVGVAGLMLAVMGWILAAQIVQLTAELPAYQESVARRIEAMRRSRHHGWVSGRPVSRWPVSSWSVPRKRSAHPRTSLWTTR